MNRRHFFKTSAAGVAGAAIAGHSFAGSSEKETGDNAAKIREYRVLGRTGFKVSDIGIGASYLANPQLLRMALEKGLNYIDTAEHYSGGNSERNIAKVIDKSNRKSIFITTKLNLNFGGGSSKADIKRRFMRSLERMQTDYADCLMIHMCRLEQVKHQPYHDAIAELKKEGRVHFTGLSTHGIEQSIYGTTRDPMEKVMIAAAEDGRFDVGLFVYNFIQKQQGEKIIAACEKRKMGVTLMKTSPVNVYSRWKAEQTRWLSKDSDMPGYIKKKSDNYLAYLKKAEGFKKKYGLKNEQEIRAAAIKFVLSHPYVHTICCSFNNFEELDQFAVLSGKKLKSRDTAMLNRYRSDMGNLYCRHACGECEPACPHNVPVNTIMRFNHYFEAQGRQKHAMVQYHQLPGPKADICAKCSGACEKACSHNVPIQGLLLNAHENLNLV